MASQDFAHGEKEQFFWTDLAFAKTKKLLIETLIEEMQTIFLSKPNMSNERRRVNAQILTISAKHFNVAKNEMQTLKNK